MCGFASGTHKQIQGIPDRCPAAKESAINRLFERMLNPQSKRSGDRKASFQPRLEALEDRLLLSGDLAVHPSEGFSLEQKPP